MSGKEIGKVRGFATIGIILFETEKFKRGILSAIKNEDPQLERRYIADACHSWSEKAMKFFDVRLNVINAENIPTKGPVVYVANHQSYFDMFIFHYLIPHQVGFIAKKEWSKIPFFNRWVELTGCIYIDRGNLRESLKSINTGAEYLKKGYSLVIFPEGTRAKDGKLGEMKAGAFKLAEKAGVPIIPVCIDGSYRCFEEKGKFVKGHTVNVTFHEAIPTKGLSRKDFSEIPKKVTDLIYDDLETIEKKHSEYR